MLTTLNPGIQVGDSTGSTNAHRASFGTPKRRNIPGCVTTCHGPNRFRGDGFRSPYLLDTDVDRVSKTEKIIHDIHKVTTA